MDFIPIQNVPVLLITSDSNTSNLSSRVKRFKEVIRSTYTFDVYFNVSHFLLGLERQRCHYH